MTSNQPVFPEMKHLTLRFLFPVESDLPAQLALPEPAQALGFFFYNALLVKLDQLVLRQTHD